MQCTAAPPGAGNLLWSIFDIAAIHSRAVPTRREETNAHGRPHAMQAATGCILYFSEVSLLHIASCEGLPADMGSSIRHGCWDRCLHACPAAKQLPCAIEFARLTVLTLLHPRAPSYVASVINTPCNSTSDPVPKQLASILFSVFILSRRITPGS